MMRLLVACSVPFLVASASATLPQAPSDAERAAREAEFEKVMSGCKMVGQFTVTGSKAPPEEESYTIAKVSKLRDDKWRFDATIEYGGKSATVPLAVDVHWAGDTPMIQVTDLQVPTLGKYSARVVIYGDQYAGIWSGADHGGHMFGRIERSEGKQGKPDKQDTAEVWPTWRGPDGNGVAPSGDPPSEWSEEKNIRWKVAIPGLGSSSPIVWNDRVYLTTAIETEEEGQAPAQQPPERAGGGEGENRRRGGRRGGRGGRGFGRGRQPTKVHQFVVMALDRKDGSVVWSETVNEAVPHEGGHQTATQASNSPLTDGEHIVASFGSRGIYCLDMKGKVVWSKDLGLMRTRNGFGEGSSPAVFGDTVVVNWDHEGDSFIAAFAKSTGDELWRTPRDEITSWSTPLIVQVDGSPQVVVNATGASHGYDLATGEELWTCEGMTTNCIPSPNHRDGVVYLMSGFRGSNMQAIRLAGAKGDLEGSKNLLWSHGRNTSYVPSALLYDDYLYFLRVNNAVLTCLDADTGKVHYEGQKLDGLRSVYSSPVGAAGRVYLASRDGVTKVFKLGSEYEEIATNTLDDGFDATPAIVGSEIYLRGRESLYCIAEK